jgi:hypothetical protein
MRQTFRNETTSIILIYVQLFGRYEFSMGPLQFGILVKKAPLIKYFDSLTLKHFGFYMNLVRHFVAYSQPFNLVYR